jgi:hypothetical protein
MLSPYRCRFGETVKAGVYRIRCTQIFNSALYVPTVTRLGMDIEPIPRMGYLDLDLIVSPYRHLRHLSESQLWQWALEFVLFCVWVEECLCHFML